MRQGNGGLAGFVVLLVAVLAATGCGQQSVSQLRQNYEAELNGWRALEEPVAIVSEVDTVKGDAGTGEEPSEGEGATTVVTEPETVIKAQTVLLDILVSHSSGGTLPGITIDIWQADANEQDKENWKLWVDTSDLAVSKQISHSLEGVNLEHGDLFTVEVRDHVPDGERGEYREFSEQP